jgi:hypothetical protein
LWGDSAREADQDADGHPLVRRAPARGSKRLLRHIFAVVGDATTNYDNISG